MSTVVKDLGAVSAYAYAVEKGYTGTEAEFAELMADYAEVGQRAEDAAESALNSKTAAQTAATTATNKASEATTAATTATTKAGEAQTSAQTASSKASEASQSASQASGYAQTAETAKTAAQTAKTQAETARDNAVTAKTAAETAQGKAEDAQAAAESVAESIPSDYSQLSEDVSDLKEDLNGISDKVLHVSPNLLNFDDSDFLVGYYINPSKGNQQSSSLYNTTGYIPVEEGETYTYTYGTVIGNAQSMRFITAYDAEKNVIPSAGAQSVTKYTVPENVAYIRVSATANYLNTSSTNIMIYKGTSIDAYYEYYEPYETVKIKNDALDTDFIKETALNNLSTADLKNNYGCAIPNGYVFRQTVGLPETWYKINMVTPPTDFIALGVGAGYYTKNNKSFIFGNETALDSSNGYSWAWYDSLLNLVTKYKGTGLGAPRKIIAENLNDCTALVIGDSTVDFDTMTRYMLDYFTEKGHTLTLLGTIGDGSTDNRNEGRAGWKASDYLTNKSYNGVVNPFYNPNTGTFDFSYYMTNQGYSAVDFVIIQLGINDLYNSGASVIEPTWDCVKTMIDSIFAYNNSIKVLLNLPTPPNTDESTHGTVSGFLYRNRVIRYNEYAMAKALELYNTGKVRPTWCHLILDPDTDIRDNVHPTNDGFHKMAMEVINQINVWQNGK